MDTRIHLSRLLALFLALALGLSLLPVGQPAQAASADIVISQVYGGGGNSGATYTHDFIELFNRGNTSISLNGWSVQYTSATGTANFGANSGLITELTDISLAPGQYLLIQEAQGSGGTTPLPTPDVIDPTPIAMAATGGKVALVNTTTPLGCNGSSTSCSAEALATIIDLVGYGNANFFEGSGATPAPSNTTAVFRINGGCTDTDDNAADFVTGAPNPRNTASPMHSCTAPTNPSGVGAADPAAVFPGETSLLTVTVTPGTNPTSTGLAVSGDLTPIGGPAMQPFTDDGDNVFSFLATVVAGTEPGLKELAITITDAEGRSGSTTVALTVSAPGVTPGSVVISQVYGGGGNVGATYTHDFIELLNRSASPVNVSGWSVQYASAAGTTWQVTALSGTIQPGQYYLIQQAAGAGGTTPLPTPDATGTTAMSATSGKVALTSQTTALSGACPTGAQIIDFVGYGSANCFEGSAPTPTLSNTTAALRKLGGFQDTDDNAADFEVDPPNPRNSTFVDTAPEVISTNPTDGAMDAPLNTDITITFSEPVDVSGEWFSIACTETDSHSAAASGGPTTFTLSTANDFAIGETCTVTVFASQVTDQDLLDPPDNMEADYSWSFTVIDVCPLPYTPIYEIQGAGMTSPLLGQTVSTLGVVVGDFQNNSQPDHGDLNGFFIQDPTGDGDPATSDGVFVFAPGSIDVSVGDHVRVRGTVAEFFNRTELSGVSLVLQCSTGNPLPAATTVELPVTSLSDFERFEGMLVTFPQTLFISEYFNFDRFGEIVLTTGRQFQPTAVFEPGSTEAAALAQANLLSRITLDDGRTTQNPDPAIHPNGNVFDLNNLFRGGDTVQNVTGVMDFAFSLYRIQPTQGADYTAANPRPEQHNDVGGNLKVASFNVLNYFTTIDTGAFICGPAGNQECRGADNAEEFTRQRDKIIAALVAMDADVVGLIEIENHPGDVPTADLVSGLNDVMGAGSYDYIATGAIGTDAIRVAFIYKPASVSLAGAYAVLDTSVDARFLDDFNRPVLAQTFQDNSTGGIFTVAVNHLKSKGSDCNAIGDPDTGDGQGNCNLTRKAAAEAMVDWLASDPTGSNDADFLIIGDLNAYDKEDPIDAILAGSYTDLVFKYEGEFAYSFVFDGQLGYLDHALASSSVTAQVTGASVWHINADEPDLIDYDTTFKQPAQAAIYAPDAFRSSDHDPVIVGLDLIHYDFSGFFPPVSNPPTFNVVRAGSAVPVRFSLGGDQGLDIFAAGYPKVQVIDCNSSDPDSGVDETVNAGGSSLTYDPDTDQYTYVWKTDRNWAGSCRQLVIQLKDGSIHRANFKFTR